ncbi:hypothetical protein L1987_02099 [Smallanthus sonchifolius]|uniref:Uncharacterized protein n=1 Tax=Smallanthus sonchifolius TaxID=185202 RepID=A0ACB9K6X4_9ASTR|nr:hypothetical protein L1987_02099 [Smallanthus sonchifolius]
MFVNRSRLRQDTDPIEDVSGHVHAKTRQKSCSEAASSARCLIRVFSSTDILSYIVIRLCEDKTQGLV